MKFSNFIAIVSIIIMILSLIITIRYNYNSRLSDAKNIYLDAIELSLDAALKSSNDGLDDFNYEKLATHDYKNASFNKEKSLKEFFRMMSLNLYGSDEKWKYIYTKIDALIFLEDDGIVMNVYDNELSQRVFLNKVPYIDDKGQMIKISEGDLEHEIENRITVIDTLKRELNLLKCDVDIPYEDIRFSNSIFFKSILVVMKDLKIARNSYYDIIKFKVLKMDYCKN